MKKNSLRFLSLLLALCLSAGILASCGGGEEETSSVDSQTIVNTETEGETKSQDTEGSTSADTEPETETEMVVELQGEEAELIQLAHDLKNGVNPYYSDASRNEVTIENQTMNLGYVIGSGNRNMQVSHLSTPTGNDYITNTMDVVLNMQNGKSYLASASKDNAILNIYRYGYYYYETRLEGQSFMNDLVTEKEIVIQPDKYSNAVGVKRPEMVDGVFTYRMGADNDPQLQYKVNFDAAEYEYLEITLRPYGR